MLYPGRIHDFHGPPESLKSWCAQIAVAEVLKADLEALYLDFEAEARDVVGHLLALGVSKGQLAQNLHYIRPDEPLTDSERAFLVHNLEYWPLDISVLDGVNNAMVASGFEPNSNMDVRKWWERLPRPIQLATRGPTVLIDHVAKNKETRGDWAVGAGQKLAGIDGASFTFDPIQPFGRGRTGLSRLLLSKDRPGGLRGHAIGKELARLRLVSAETGDVAHEFLVPSGLGEGEDPTDARWKPTFYMQRVSELLERSTEALSKNAIESSITGKATYVREALAILIADGHVQAVAGPRGATLHNLLKPYVDPTSRPELSVVTDPEDDLAPTSPRPRPGEVDDLVPTSSPPRPDEVDDGGLTSSPNGVGPPYGAPPVGTRSSPSPMADLSGAPTSSRGGAVRKACPACGSFAWSEPPQGPPWRRCHKCGKVWTPTGPVSHLLSIPLDRPAPNLDLDPPPRRRK